MLNKYEFFLWFLILKQDVLSSRMLTVDLAIIETQWHEESNLGRLQ